jgi:hypothetical protein
MQKHFFSAHICTAQLSLPIFFNEIHVPLAQGFSGRALLCSRPNFSNNKKMQTF